MEDIKETNQEQDVNSLGEINTSNKVGKKSKIILWSLIGLVFIILINASIFG